MNSKPMPREGIVIRVDNYTDFVVYKYKCNAFYEYETKVLDSGEEVNE